MVWSCFWFALVTDSPNDHPKISREELNYIESSLKNDKPERQVVEIRNFTERIYCSEVLTFAGSMFKNKHLNIDSFLFIFIRLKMSHGKTSPLLFQYGLSLLLMLQRIGAGILC